MRNGREEEIKEKGQGREGKREREMKEMGKVRKGKVRQREG